LKNCYSHCKCGYPVRAKEVIEECNDFPSGTNDDLVDSTTLALLRFRQGGFIKLPSDEADDDIFYKYSKKKAYY
jgi:phage terminase large subunit-like protein